MEKTNNKRNNEEFLQSVKDQLYIETFKIDVSEYSEETIDALVKLVNTADRTDEKEVNESYEKFIINFQKITSKKQKENQKTKKTSRSYYRKFARGAAAILAIFMLADITSHAFMDGGLLRVIGRWANQISIIPGESSVETEAVDYQEANTSYFTDVETFAEHFQDDFMVCSWLPDGVELDEIILTELEDSCNYLWIYRKDYNGEAIVVRMYEKVDSDIAGLTGSEIKDEEKITFKNGIVAIFCSNNTECMAIFEYNNWWYTVHIFSDDETLKTIVGGMVRYE